MIRGMIKRLLAVTLCILITGLPVYGVDFDRKFLDHSTYLWVASGTVTLANMKISGVDGTAFIDFTAAGVLTTKIGNLLEVYDSSNKKITFWNKTAGTGETLSATNLVTSWTNVNYDVFTSVASPDIASAIYSTSGTQTATSNSMVTVVGGLYNLVATWTNVSGQAPTLTGTNGFKTTTLSGGANNIYFTATGTSIVITTTNTTAASWGCTFVLKQVTAPSATGCTGVLTKGGGTFNFAFKDAAFNYGSVTFTYKIYKSTTAVVVAGPTAVTQANTHLDTTTTNAFVWLNGVDLSTYQDGRHMIGLYNATGRFGALGHISSTPPAGESLGLEKHSDPGFADTAVWTKGTAEWTVSGGEGIATAVASGITLYQTSVQMTTATVVGGLYKAQFDVTALTPGGGFANRLTSTGVTGITRTAVGAGYTDYFTSTSTASGSGVITIGTTTGKVDNKSLKNVSDPPSTGAKIVSTKGGATRSFFYTNPSFNPNDLSGITYVVYFIGD